MLLPLAWNAVTQLLLTSIPTLGLHWFTPFTIKSALATEPVVAVMVVPPLEEVCADASATFEAGCALVVSVLVVPPGCGQTADGKVLDCPFDRLPQL